MSTLGSPQGGVTSIRKVCQLMDRCDSHVGGERGLERCDTCQYVEGLFDSYWPWESVSLRNFYLFFFLQENPRCWEHLGFS